MQIRQHAAAQGSGDVGLRQGMAPAEPKAVAVTVAVLCVLTVLSLYGEWSAHPTLSAGLRALDITAAVLGCILIAFAPRMPVPSATALGAMGAVTAAATPLAGTAVLWLASRMRLQIAVAVAAIAVAGQVARGLWRPVSMPLPWWFAFQVAIFAAVIGWGAMTRARRAVIVSLAERARRAEADQARREEDARRAERARIAREMHDVLAHRLSLLATFAGALEYRPDAPPAEMKRAAGEIRNGARQALDELREVIGVLRDDAGDGGTAPTARPQPTMADLPQLIGESRDAGMTVRVDDRTTGASVPDGIGRSAYRVVQEALTNARKHAPGQPVDVVLSGAPGAPLVIEVSNPVAATPGTPAAPGSGSGLIGLTERVGLVGGSLEHGVTPEGAFRLRASLRWPA